MAENCVKLGCPEFIRLALQDQCTGAPVPGATNGAIIRCSRNVTAEAVNIDPQVSEFTSDCGSPDRYVLDGQRQGFNLTFEVANLSPEFDALVNGDTLIDDTGVNIGVIYEGPGAACLNADPDPRFIAELFYRVRQCNSAGIVTDYVRFIITGLHFEPSAMDKEGQIGFMRYTATSEATLAEGLTSGNAGPFDDLPVAVAADITALPAGFTTPGLWFTDTTDPTAGAPLAVNTCYTTAVPVVA